MDFEKVIELQPEDITYLYDEILENGSDERLACCCIGRRVIDADAWDSSCYEYCYRHSLSTRCYGYNYIHRCCFDFR